MPFFRQIALRPGVYETDAGRQVALSPGDLVRCRDNTLRLLARGWRVPVFVGHVEYASGEGGPRLVEPSVPQRWVGRAPSSTAVGWLVDLTLEPDGALAQVVHLQRQYLSQLRRARLRHTSPEIRPSFALETGETIGPVIAHIALTRRPVCRGQTRLAPVREAATSETNDHDSENSSMKGNAMTNEQEPIAPAGDDAGGTTVAPGAPLDQPETDGLGSPSYEDAADDRATLAERIRRSRKLPKGLRERLCEFVETLQLSADAPGKPVVPVAEAVAMIEAAVPEHLALADDEVEAPPHPRGEDFFRGHATGISDEEADRIASEQLAASGFGPAN